MAEIIVTVPDDVADQIRRYQARGYRLGWWFDVSLEGKSPGSWMGEPREWDTTVRFGTPCSMRLSDR